MIRRLTLLLATMMALGFGMQLLATEARAEGITSVRYDITGGTFGGKILRSGQIRGGSLVLSHPADLTGYTPFSIGSVKVFLSLTAGFRSPSITGVILTGSASIAATPLARGSWGVDPDFVFGILCSHGLQIQSAGNPISTISAGNAPGSGCQYNAFAARYGYNDFLQTYQDSGNLRFWAPATPQGQYSFNHAFTIGNEVRTTPEPEPDPGPGPPTSKVLLCHGSGGSEQTLTVGAQSVAQHIAHGDTLGACL